MKCSYRQFLIELFFFRPSEVEDAEYDEFYKAITKDTQDPLAHTHFVAEGEVTFKSVLYIPKVQQSESFNKYGTKTDNIKVIFKILMKLILNFSLKIAYVYSFLVVRSSSFHHGRFPRRYAELFELCSWCRRFWRFAFECFPRNTATAQTHQGKPNFSLFFFF